MQKTDQLINWPAHASVHGCHYLTLIILYHTITRIPYLIGNTCTDIYLSMKAKSKHATIDSCSLILNLLPQRILQGFINTTRMVLNVSIITNLSIVHDCMSFEIFKTNSGYTTLCKIII